MFTSISHRLCLVHVLPVVCCREHVLFTLIVCVYVCVRSGLQDTLCCVFALFYFVVCTLCGQLLFIFIFGSPFGILLRLVIED